MQCRDDVTQCSACRISLLTYPDESESISNPYPLTSVGRTETLLTLIFTSISNWITGIKMRRKIKEALGRKATDADLSSIDTWTKVNDVETKHEGTKRGPD
jgi:hypothetical protein